MAGAAALAVMALAACSPESFDGPNSFDIPEVMDYDTKVTIDQEKNIATFNLIDKNGNAAKGVYPIWEITTTSTVKVTNDGYKTPVVPVAGTYSYTMRVGNANGISDGLRAGNFTFNETKYDFSSFLDNLTDGGTKEWHVYAAKQGHLACGESLTNSANWYAASPNEKSSQGIYDDRISFTAGSSFASGEYKYNAGNDGLTFCNSGVNTLGVTGAKEDYSAPCIGVNGAQTDVSYSLGYKADVGMVTITLPAKTLFPYMASNDFMNGSYTLYVTEINSKTMTCVIQLQGICWQIIFLSGENE